MGKAERFTAPMTFNLPAAVEKNIGYFTGRVWLLPHLVNWLMRTESRIFILTGEPGTGKSTAIAWLAGEGPLPAQAEAQDQLRCIRQFVKAVHFCMTATGSCSPRNFTESITNQLTIKIEGFGDALVATLGNQVRISSNLSVGVVAPGSQVTGIHIERLELAGSNEEDDFNRGFREPLKKLYANGRTELILILVDALDEAFTYTGRLKLPDLLSKLDDLPPNVRFLITTRSDPQVLKFYGRIKPLDLIKDDPTHLKDVYCYACVRLEEAGIKSPHELADRIANSAQGVFLYAQLVLDDFIFRRTDISNLDFPPLPDGLPALYQDFLNRELGKDKHGWKTNKRFLGIIGVSQGDGLTHAQVKQILGQDDDPPVDICGQYLSGEFPDGPFRLFHKSFADFLLTNDKRNIHYRIDAKQMHSWIGKFFCKVFDTLCQVPAEAAQDYVYFFRYGPYHLVQACMKQKLIQYFGTEDWWGRKREHTTPLDMLDDLHLIIKPEEADCVDKVAGFIRISEPEEAKIYQAFLTSIRNIKEEAFWSKFRGLMRFYGRYSEWPIGLRDHLENSDDAYTKLFLGNTFDMEEKYEEAKAQFENLLKMAEVGNDPKFESHASVRLATVFNHLGRHRDALKTIERYVGAENARERYGNGFWWMQYQRAIFLKDLKCFDGAQKTFEQVQKNIKTEGTKLEARHQMGVIFLELDDLQKARECFEQCLNEREQKVVKDHRLAYDYRRLAQVFALSGDFEKSIDHFKKAIEISKKFGNSRYMKLAEREQIIFTKIPLSIMETKPERLNLIELLAQNGLLIDKSEDDDNRWSCLKSSFRVLAKQNLYYLEKAAPQFNHSTGECFNWGVIHAQGIWHKTVSVLAFDDDNLALLQQRVEKDSFGKWDLSATGHVDVGETDEDAALREAWEELGVLLSPDQLCRIGEPYCFYKQGDPQFDEYKHLDPYRLQYQSDKKNYEYVSIFVTKLTKEKWDHGTTRKTPSGHPVINRLEINDLIQLVNEKPGVYASGVKQILHSEIIQRINETVSSRFS